MSEVNNLWLFAQVLMKFLWRTGLGPALVAAILVEIKLERRFAHAESHHRRLFLVSGRKQTRDRENVLLVVRPSR